MKGGLCLNTKYLSLVFLRWMYQDIKIINPTRIDGISVYFKPFTTKL